MGRRVRVGAVVAALVLAASSAAARPPAVYENCSHFNARYPHGIGRAGARDHSSHPVTTFRRSTKLYKRAMHYNSDLDRDRDGVACEKP